MKNIALIPARGGSKRLPHKNILNLGGKPLIWYTIDICLQSNAFDRVIVSTDSPDIAELSIEYGAEIPFLRPENLASDGTGDREVMLHAINWLRQNENYSCDNLFYMRPTTPFKTIDMVFEVSDMLNDMYFSSVRSVTKVSGVYHPYWMFKPKDRLLAPFFEGISTENYYQSQLLPDCYRLNGVIDAVRIDTLSHNSDIFGSSIGYLEVNDYRSIDIDTEFDFKLCEFFLKEYFQLPTS